jgi:hypothetical protein
VSIESLIQDASADWTRGQPAADEQVERLAAALPDLPPDYLAFLRHCNGGEGALGTDPGRFSLWPAEEVATLNSSYRVDDFLPGFLAFGSDGGGEMLVFGAAGDRWGRVFAVPFIPMEEGRAREIAPDFATLARLFGRR